MARPKGPDKESKVSSVMTWVNTQKRRTHNIRNQWTVNFEQFVNGSAFLDKEDWQSNFTLGKYGTAIRDLANKVREVLFTQPDWYDLEPHSPSNEAAEVLAPLYKRWIDFHLDKANFQRKASTFLLMSQISMGSMAIGWKQEIVPNPDFILDKIEKQRQEDQKVRAPHVANPKVVIDEEAAIEASFAAADDNIQELRGVEDSPPTELKKKEWLQVGRLDLQIINPHRRYWDPDIVYLEEAKRGAYETQVPLWQLKEWAKLGIVDKKAVEGIKPSERTQVNEAYHDLRYKRTTSEPDTDLVTLLVYFGPLIHDNEVKNPRWGCWIVNGSTLVKEFEEYPYWEPPGHSATPFVDSSGKEVPFRPTGAGAGDNAVIADRAFDSNMNLANDAMRFNTAGINIADVSMFLDQSFLETGVEPGKILQTMGKPGEVFQHINLTSNIEKQWDPINQLLKEVILEQVGTNDLSLGGPVTRSRVTSTEVDARQQGADRVSNAAALDLTTTWITPMLEKVLARILQNGFEDLETPEMQQLFSSEERQAIKAFSQDGQKRDIIGNWFQFNVKGFTSRLDNQTRIDKLNELFTIANSGGPAGQVIDTVGLVREIAKALEIEDADEFIGPATEFSMVQLENRMLLADKQVQVSPEDNDELHMESHGILLNSGSQTQALAQHMQMHQQQFQQKQLEKQRAEQLQEEQNQGGPPAPQNGIPPQQLQ